MVARGPEGRSGETWERPGAENGNTMAAGGCFPQSPTGGGWLGPAFPAVAVRKVGEGDSKRLASQVDAT